MHAQKAPLMQNKIEVFIFKFNLSENSTSASQRNVQSPQKCQAQDTRAYLCSTIQDRIIRDIFLKRLYIGFLRFKIYLKMKIVIQRSCCVRNNRLIDWWTGDCLWYAQDRTASFFLRNLLVYYVCPISSTSNKIPFCYLFLCRYSFVSFWFKT